MLKSALYFGSRRNACDLFGIVLFAPKCFSVSIFYQTVQMSVNVIYSLVSVQCGHLKYIPLTAEDCKIHQYLVKM